MIERTCEGCGVPLPGDRRYRWCSSSACRAEVKERARLREARKRAEVGSPVGYANCETCGQLFTLPHARPALCCSVKCKTKRDTTARVTSGRTKSVNLSERERERRKEYQAANWTRWASERTCAVCDRQFIVRSGHSTAHCSRSCGVAARRVVRTCLSCVAEPASKTARYCKPCAMRRQREAGSVARSPLRVAIESRDGVALREALLACCVEDGSHLIWQGKAKKGYPAAGWAEGIHRLVFAAIHGDPGAMPVHHKCGYSLCLNPDHLQVVTPIENTAEMLERRWYLERIQNLEDALAKVDPGNKLLAVPLLGADPHLWGRLVSEEVA